MNVILLPTYNGAAWLPEFLASVQRQTQRDWRMLIRDDGSSDATVQILTEAAAGDARLQLLGDGEQRLGVTQNVARLMQHAGRLDAGYVFLADQDDVWVADKLRLQLAAMAEVEAAAGNDVPILVHTDLAVVDRDLRTIHPSHTAFAGIRRTCPPRRALPTLLMHNFVTGCATLINRPLLEAALPVPHDAVLHDWWIASCAAALGKIHYFPQSLVLYRQHGGNTVGANGFWRRTSVRELVGRTFWQRVLSSLQKSGAQAEALRNRIHEQSTKVSDDSLAFVEDYCRLFRPDQTAWRRLTRVVRMRCLPSVDRALLAIATPKRLRSMDR